MRERKKIREVLKIVKTIGQEDTDECSEETSEMPEGNTMI